MRPPCHSRRLDSRDAPAQHGGRSSRLRSDASSVLSDRSAARDRGRGRSVGRRRFHGRADRPRHSGGSDSRSTSRAWLGGARASTRTRGPPRAVPLDDARFRRLLRRCLLEGHVRGQEGGLRLDRAGQALHDGHDGPLAGQARVGQRRGDHGRGPRSDRPQRDRHHGLASAVRADHPRGPRWSRIREHSLLADAIVARAAQRQAARRRRLDPSRALRRRRCRGRKSA